jgi:hypothetical protein
MSVWIAAKQPDNGVTSVVVLKRNGDTATGLLWRTAPISINTNRDAYRATRNLTETKWRNIVRSMSSQARRFFLENPDRKYFYPNANARIPNPRLYNGPDWEHEPWPEVHSVHNT